VSATGEAATAADGNAARAATTASTETDTATVR
jgi:hypothetical protein